MAFWSPRHGHCLIFSVWEQLESAVHIHASTCTFPRSFLYQVGLSPVRDTKQWSSKPLWCENRPAKETHAVIETVTGRLEISSPTKWGQNSLSLSYLEIPTLFFFFVKKTFPSPSHVNDEKKKSRPRGNGEENTQSVIFASKSRVCAGIAFPVMRTLGWWSKHRSQGHGMGTLCRQCPWFAGSWGMEFDLRWGVSAIASWANLTHQNLSINFKHSKQAASPKIRELAVFCGKQHSSQKKWV